MDAAENTLQNNLNLGMISIVRFRISKEMVVEFSKLTGDCNPMHLNEEFARRSMYRQIIVHGMLPIAFISLFDFLNIQGHISSIVYINGQFIEPVYVGDKLSLQGEIININENEGVVEVTYSIRKIEKDIVVINGRMKVRYINTQKDGEESHKVYERRSPATMIAESLKLQSLRLEEISVKDRDEFNFTILENSINGLMEILSEGILEENQFTPLKTEERFHYANLLSIMLFSTSVGICIPGKYATFLSFELEINKSFNSNVSYKLGSEVAHISSSTHIIRKDIVIHQSENEKDTYLSGKVSILVNPPPAKMPTFSELKESGLDMGLKDKVVLITGGSRGIGETTAKLFALLGAKVIVNYLRGKKDAKRIGDEIKEEGGEAFPVQADVANPHQVQRMIRKVIERYGGVDILVNNAVRDFRPIDFSTLSWEDIQKDIDVVVKGAYNCCKEVIPLMSNRGGGKIINIGTVATDNPPPNQIKYVIAKSGLVGLTRSLSVAFANKNIQINMVVPSFVETDLVSHIPSVYRKRIALDTPMQRNASSIDVAKAIIFLASAYSSFITGQKIMVTGGAVPYL